MGKKKKDGKPAEQEIFHVPLDRQILISQRAATIQSKDGSKVIDCSKQPFVLARMKSAIGEHEGTSEPWRVLIDTGCTCTLVPFEIAKRSGIDVEKTPDREIETRGIAGSTLGYTGMVDFEFVDIPNHHLRSPCIFVPDHPDKKEHEQYVLLSYDMIVRNFDVLIKEGRVRAWRREEGLHWA